MARYESLGRILTSYIVSNTYIGSFLEFMPILQLLKDRYNPKTLPYHIIVPSLPGYAYSAGRPLDRGSGNERDSRSEKDFGVEDIAQILDRLMSKLGFGDGYIVQGGDFGSRVGRLLAATYPSCKGKSALISS